MKHEYQTSSAASGPAGDNATRSPTIKGFISEIPRRKIEMKAISILKLKDVIGASVGVLAAILLVVATRSKAKPTAQAWLAPVVEVAPVEQRDVPAYGEWIGTLAELVTADVKAQVTGYLLRWDYKEGSYVRKGQLLFEIDPRPFKAALD
jgi:multidrug efflux pump subunit AcrA (membrane-fusion protein)